MRGSALETTVLESIATNIASSRPLRASSTSRCVISPACSAAGGGAWRVCLRHGCSIHAGDKVAEVNYIPRGPSCPPDATGVVGARRTCSDPQAWCRGEARSGGRDVRITCGSGDCCGFASS